MLAGIRLHSGSDEPSPTVTPVVNADVEDPQDTLAVYDAAHGVDSPPYGEAVSVRT